MQKVHKVGLHKICWIQCMVCTDNYEQNNAKVLTRSSCHQLQQQVSFWKEITVH